MKANPRLQTFLTPYDEEIQELCYRLRDFVVALVPEANELIWDNYNAVAIAYSKSEQLKDAFCHIAVYGKHLNFGFNRGSELSSESLQLKGQGKLIRHLTVNDWDTFPKEKIRPLIFQALGISEMRNPKLQVANAHPKSMVMSISDKKIRPKK